MTDTAKLYGDSLYDLAETDAEKRAYLEELQCVARLFRENPEYRSLLSEPSVALKERLGLLDEAFGQASPYVLNFLKLLVDEGLIGELFGCAEEVKARYYEEFGIAEAVVTTAVRLNEDEEKAMKASLEKRFSRRIILQNRVDPGVMGGVMVEVNGTRLDGTLKGSLDRLHEAIRKPAIQAGEDKVL